MKLYELANNTIMQGNIRITRESRHGDEIELLHAIGVDDLAYQEIEDFEDLDVLYIWPDIDFDGRPLMVIELEKEE